MTRQKLSPRYEDARDMLARLGYRPPTRVPLRTSGCLYSIGPINLRETDLSEDSIELSNIQLSKSYSLRNKH